MQLKFLAAFSASDLVSNRAVVPFDWGFLEHPISENEMGKNIIKTTSLKLFNFIELLDTITD